MIPCVEVRHIKKSFPTIKAVKDVSFQIQEGELFALLGENGAGKSTIINILSTLMPQDEGEAVICSLPIGKENQRIRSIIGIVFQEHVLDAPLTGRENLKLRASLYYKDKKDVYAAIMEAIEAVDAKDFIDQPYGSLSGGQKRRLDIARALLHHPKLLFLDEPTTGLDPQARHALWECILHLQKEWKMSILLTTHYMEEANYADHIVLLDHGEIIAEGTPENLKQTYGKETLDEVFLVLHNRKESAL